MIQGGPLAIGQARLQELRHKAHQHTLAAHRPVARTSAHVSIRVLWGLLSIEINPPGPANGLNSGIPGDPALRPIGQTT